VTELQVDGAALVRVHRIGAGQVSKQNLVVLEAASILLEDLAVGDHLTLDLLLPLPEVSEIGLRMNLTLGKDLKTVWEVLYFSKLTLAALTDSPFTLWP
jgi:hypothetical protein